jgi:hypothetical protein
MGFTLYGGTAIALQLGHRQSVDFDLFTDRNLSESAILREMPFLNHAQVIQASNNTLTMAYPVDKEQVKISMFGGITFGRVGTPLIANGNALPVASLDDLMSTNLKVILQRAKKKDYYMDIAEMIRNGVSLEKGIGSACSMFGKTFPPKDCLAALTYFKDGDLETLSKKDMETLLRQSSKIKEVHPQKIISKVLGVSELDI